LYGVCDGLPVCQHATAKVGPKLLLDEAGSWLVPRSRVSQEGLELLTDDPVQERLLGRSRRVAVCSFPKDRALGVRPSASRSLGVVRFGAAGSGHRARGPMRSACRACSRPTLSSRRRESRGSQTGRAFGSREASGP
jgi:hypothetical protein